MSLPKPEKVGRAVVALIVAAWVFGFAGQLSEWLGAPSEVAMPAYRLCYSTLSVGLGVWVWRVSSRMTPNPR